MKETSDRMGYCIGIRKHQNWQGLKSKQEAGIGKPECGVPNNNAYYLLGSYYGQVFYLDEFIYSAHKLLRLTLNHI